MICYKDKTFCSFYKTCANAEGCDRCLTTGVIVEADRHQLPICSFVAPPKNCYKEIVASDNESSPLQKV